MSRLVNLHTRSWYSLLEGVCSPEELVKSAADLGYSSLALTDSDTLAGAVEFTEAVAGTCVRPIIGAKLRQGSQAATVLVADTTGYRCLCQVMTKLNLAEGKNSLSLLLADTEGLHVLIDDPIMAKPPLSTLRGRVWAELVRPGKTEQQERALIDATAKLGIKPVASLGAHFAKKEDYRIYRLLTAIRRGATLDNLPAKLAATAQNHLIDGAEMRERFRDMPNALSNAITLAESCRSDVLPRGVVLPPVNVPPGQEALGYLRSLCEQALTRRVPLDLPAARHRLEVELSLIADRDLASYFLLLGEIGAEAKRQGWPLAVSGSAAASLVLHLIGVSETDPVACGLRVERFLHPGRADLPDVDLLCADDQRRSVFQWLVKRHGRDRVARVGLIKHFRAKSALKAAALANGLAEAQTDTLIDSLDLEGDGALNRERLNATPATWPLEADGWSRVLAAARALNGKPREARYHPSAVVLTADSIDSLCPSLRGPGDVRVLQLDGAGVERIGLLKLDILSSHALTAIASARRHLQAIDPPAATQVVEDGDAAVVALLSSGDTIGISQLETPGRRKLLQQVAPANLADLMGVLAASEPGAGSGGGRDEYLRRRRGQEQAVYLDPGLEAVLHDSYGVPLFDDDALSMVEVLTALPAPEADRLRKLVAAGAAGIDEEFISACETAGTPKEAADEALSQLKRFSNYSFCKSHAATTARTAWAEAWLRARHPLAFWCAILNRHGDGGNYSRWVLVEEAKRSGVLVVGPCLNRSRVEWTQEVSCLRAGLKCVSSLGAQAMLAVIEERERSGPFANLPEFLRRMQGQVQSPDLVALINAGALDCFGRGRGALLRENETARRRQFRRKVEPWPLAGVDDSPMANQRGEEWAAVGFAPGLPLLSLVRRRLPTDLFDSRALVVAPSGQQVRLVGLVAHIDERSGRATILSILDEFGMIEARLPAGNEPLAEAELVVVDGIVEVSYGAAAIRASRMARWQGGALSSAATAAGAA